MFYIGPARHGNQRFLIYPIQCGSSCRVRAGPAGRRLLCPTAAEPRAPGGSRQRCAGRLPAGSRKGPGPRSGPGWPRGSGARRSAEPTTFLDNCGSSWIKNVSRPLMPFLFRYEKIKSLHINIKNARDSRTNNVTTSCFIIHKIMMILKIEPKYARGPCTGS